MRRAAQPGLAKTARRDGSDPGRSPSLWSRPRPGPAGAALPPRPPPAHAARRSAAGAAPASPLAASPAQGVRGRPEARTAESLTREAARARRPPRVDPWFSVGVARLAMRRVMRMTALG